MAGCCSNEDGDTVRQCRVVDCDANLAQDKGYCMKKLVCSAHMRAPAVRQRGCSDQWWRFCFQCGKLEPLELFDGDQRSCRKRLERRRKTSQVLPPIEVQRSTKRARIASTSCGGAVTASAALAMQQQQLALMWQSAAYEGSTDESSCSLQASAGKPQSPPPALQLMHGSSTCGSAAVTAALGALDAAADAGTAEALAANSRRLRDLQHTFNCLEREVSGGGAAAPQLQCAAPVKHTSLDSCASHMDLVEAVVAQLDASDDTALEAQQLEAFIEEELRAAAARPATSGAGSAQPATSPALALNAQIEGLCRSISGASCMTGVLAGPGCFTAAAAAPLLLPQPPFTGLAARMRGSSASTSTSSLAPSGQPTAAASAQLDAELRRLRSLQDSVAQLHDKISFLRRHVHTAV